MTRRNILIVLLVGIFALVFASFRCELALPLSYPLGRSGHSFTIGERFIDIDYGYVDDGDKLVFAVIRSWPSDASTASILNDPRYDLNPGGLPRVRHNDGQLREVATDGHVYVFFGDELRTMRVEMDEHSDTVGFSRQKNMDGIWDYLKQFQVKQ